ncbi:hypothetical protein PPSIR1_30494 [Plesiocystis pacifica SIR-1]|uniref:Uncharacterized protein n=1 Tax=Plesiocystis pacifica SIR-1 TaxID=391625 RepID=A6GGP7_9BACT|nr:hypothetical protein [Plesiocystis pacifica]EDM74947.1 hypothetical protein PPSIR1_30494 [Plesiocystis pacifica SIR-1]
MRCHAYQLPSEVYREIEAQILEALANADRDQLGYLLAEHDLKIELLSGEWRALFAATEDDYFQVVDPTEHRARMAVSPEEIAGFVEMLRDVERQIEWTPISFGLAELVDALPVGMDLVGVVFVEEDDDWMWSESTHELVAIRPEVYTLIEPHMRKLIEAGEWAQLSRLASDHCEGAIEFVDDKWFALGQAIVTRTPELVPIVEASLSPPGLYQNIREALSLVADPRSQPSLDAWLRVHSMDHNYALFFRDARKERG